MLISILFTALLAKADDLANQIASAGVTEFTVAYQAWDGQRFAAAVELFKQATTNAPGRTRGEGRLGPRGGKEMRQT